MKYRIKYTDGAIIVYTDSKPTIEQIYNVYSKDWDLLSVEFISK